MNDDDDPHEFSMKALQAWQTAIFWIIGVSMTLMAVEIFSAPRCPIGTTPLSISSAVSSMTPAST